MLAASRCVRCQVSTEACNRCSRARALAFQNGHNTHTHHPNRLVLCCGLALSCCSTSTPMATVEGRLHAEILQRTHALMSQYAAMPASWQQLWEEADTDSQQAAAAAAVSGSTAEVHSVTAVAAAAGLLQLLDNAVYDAEAQVLMPVGHSNSRPAAADDPWSATAAAAAPQLSGVLAEVSSAVEPLASFVGRQHLAALQALAGPVGMQQLIVGVLDKLESEQVRAWSWWSAFVCAVLR